MIHFHLIYWTWKYLSSSPIRYLILFQKLTQLGSSPSLVSKKNPLGFGDSMQTYAVLDFRALTWHPAFAYQVDCFSFCRTWLQTIVNVKIFDDKLFNLRSVSICGKFAYALKSMHGYRRRRTIFKHIYSHPVSYKRIFHRCLCAIDIEGNYDVLFLPERNYKTLAPE